MRFKSYDSLRLFGVVACHQSFTAAAVDLNMTKGAVSYQIARLEAELGFPVFIRQHRGIVLTEKGRRLWHAAHAMFRDLEREIARQREEDAARITIGMSTYFASRWLSPRLMTFTSAHPGTALRLQPIVNHSDLRAENIDMAIRWGRGAWADVETECLFACPAIVTAGATLYRRIGAAGLETALSDLTLLHDRDGSEAWAHWHAAARLPYRSGQAGLVIPDPNVRVQAVIDGQGLALNDALVSAELSSGRLFQVSPVELPNYGYHLVYPKGALEDRALLEFRNWILAQADEYLALSGKSRMRYRV